MPLFLLFCQCVSISQPIIDPDPNVIFIIMRKRAINMFVHNNTSDISAHRYLNKIKAAWISSRLLCLCAQINRGLVME